MRNGALVLTRNTTPALPALVGSVMIDPRLGHKRRCQLPLLGNIVVVSGRVCSLCAARGSVHIVVGCKRNPKPPNVEAASHHHILLAWCLLGTSMPSMQCQ